MKAKNLIKKLIYRHRADSATFIQYLRRGGAIVGENVRFIVPNRTFVDDKCLSYIEIGNDCLITGGVSILAHDWSVHVIANKYGKMLPAQRRTVIGNNVFIGLNSIILSGAHIGDNVIIGAGSVVSGVVESDSVYAGNPARKIMIIEDYYHKCEAGYLVGAKEYAKTFEKQNKRLPQIEEMGLYQPLFLTQAERKKRGLYSDSIYKSAYEGIEKQFNCVQELMEYSTSK